MQTEINDLKRQVKFLTDMYYKGNFSDNQVFTKRLVMQGGAQIGSGATSLLGFYGVAPVAQQATIIAPAGGVTVDAESRTAITQIKTTLTNLGLTA